MSTNKIYLFVLFCCCTSTLFAQSLTIPSKILQEQRHIWVHLPPGYNEQTSTCYPVIYVLDGNVHYKYVAEAVDYLASYDVNRMPRAIVVGIEHEDRGKDLNLQHAQLPNGTQDSAIRKDMGAPLFTQFLQQELVPYIDQHYRTAQYRVLIGHSLAGLFALYTKLNAPQLFNYTILISPALGGINSQLTNEFDRFLQHTNTPGKYFISIGDEDTIQVKRIVHILTIHNKSLVQFVYKKYDDENHFSVPYKSVFDALKFGFSLWFLDNYSDEIVSWSMIEQRYAKLSAEFGCAFIPNEDFLNNMGYKQLRARNVKEAILIFQKNVSFYPNSANVYDSLGEAYLKNGDTKLAIQSYEKAVALDPSNENAKVVLTKLKQSQQ
ncbi:alpha/beta hydrolase-fold protein [Chitinophaga skermanii]|nr:alpha/beta hydrolase-fold protein [Chitinophaga skermanii]